MQTETIGSPLLWIGFLVFILAMLALDLGDSVTASLLWPKSDKAAGEASHG